MKRQKQNKPGSTSRKAGSPRSEKQLISHPPPIDRFQVGHSSRIRFIATAAAANQYVTFQNLIDVINIATTATAPYNLFQACKIRYVELWGMSTIGTAKTVSLSYAGVTNGLTGDNRLHSDTSMGIEPAHLKVRPSERSLASVYQISSGSIAFVFSGPAGTVIDIGITYIGDSTGQSAKAAENVSVGATVGTVFFRGLDGLAVAGTNFLLPDGVPQY